MHIVGRASAALAATAITLLGVGLTGALRASSPPPADHPRAASSTGADPPCAPAASHPAAGHPAGQPVVAFGVQFHGMWSDYSDAQRVAVLDKLAAAGVRSVRIDVSWAMLQPTGPSSYDSWGVGFVDRVIGLANQRGIKPLITLWLTPGWANGGQGEHVLPYNPADYARAAQWAASRWRGKVVGWEVWNEPNSTDFLTNADAVGYAHLLHAAYPAFHAGDQSTVVVFGGTSYNDVDWIHTAYDNGARGSFDVMATHPYQGVANISPWSPGNGTMWTMWHVGAVRQLMISYGDASKPLWFTEFGWSTHPNAPGTANWALGVSEQTQAQYLQDTANLVRGQLPYVTRVYWYDDRDLATGNQQNDNYGLLHRDLSPKPAMTALATVNRTATSSPGPGAAAGPPCTSRPAAR